ncbi:MAG TPA: glycosyltransferase family 4 protein [bacterium]|nr:glycosyltransferase family 4 protein [bacterium]
MKVILIIPYNPLEEVGGLELATIRLAQSLLVRGYDVTIFSKGKSGNMAGVKILGFNSFPELCAEVISRKDCDVFHWLEIFPDPGEVELQGMTAGILRALGKIVILMVATSGNLENRGNGKLAQPLLLSSFDAYVISNQDQFHEFRACGFQKNIHMIGFGIDPTVFAVASSEEKLALRKKLGLPAEKVLCLFIGRFVERKRPDFLLEAWAKLEDLYPHSELIIVGSGMNQHDSIEGRVKELINSARNVRFYEVTNEPENFFRACDLLVLPSSREGQPNVLMEMMSCGNPVIASDIPGMNELLSDGENGRLFPVDDQASFIESIRDLVTNEAERRRLGVNSRQTILNQKTFDLVVGQYIELYNSLKSGG